MTQFTVTVVHPITNEQKKITYNNASSELLWEDGSKVVQEAIIQTHIPEQVKIDKGKDPNVVKILMGLSCNYECEYCNQRFVPHADETNPSDVAPFVANMTNWFKGGSDGLGEGTRFEFWGGEPFVYWKTMKPLAEAIKVKYPNTKFSIITNGSLFDEIKNNWLIEYGFSVGMSHDGPGQHVRGPDPFDDVERNKHIWSLFKELAPVNRMSFNTMLHNKNSSRIDIEKFFINAITKNLGAEYVKYLTIGEGAFVDAYDEGGVSSSLNSEESEIEFRRSSYNEIRSGEVKHFSIVYDKVNKFINSVKNGTRRETLGQKCGMDKKENLSIDLLGNVLTCQNVSTVSVNPAGISHHLGTINNLEDIEIKTGTHWSDRKECSNCPVLHLCEGACFFLDGPLWETTCNNAFSDNITTFVAGIETMTGGWLPIYIDGPLREDRKDIFWWVNGKPEKTRNGKKVIPIMAI